MNPAATGRWKALLVPALTLTAMAPSAPSAPQTLTADIEGGFSAAQGSYFYSPPVTFSVSHRGDALSVEASVSLVNDNQAHTFTIDGVVTASFSAQERSRVVPFDLAREARTVEYYCTVPGHRQGGMKNTITVELTNAAPSAPGLITPTETDDATPAIAWGAASDPDGDPVTYRIAIGRSAAATDLLPWTAVGNATTYEHPAPLPRGDVHVMVRADDGLGGESPVRSGVVRIVETLVNRAPLPPARILPDLTDDPRPTISWAASDDPDGDPLTYELRIGSSAGGENLLPWTSVGSGTSFRPADPLPLGTAYVAVRASDGELTSPEREEPVEIVAPGSGSFVPSSPEDLTAENVAAGVRLSWSPPRFSGTGSVAAYRVYRGEGEPGLLAETNGTDFSDSTATPEVRYIYEVSAENAVGESARSLPFRIQARDLAGPEAPREVGVRLDAGVLILTWQAPPDAFETFVIQDGAIVSLLPGKRDATLLHPAPGARHNVSLVARDAAGNVGASSRAVTLFVPPQPEALVSAGRITVTWRAVDVPLDLVREQPGGAEAKVVPVAAGASEYVDVEVVDGAAYAYRFSLDGGSGRSVTVTGLVDQDGDGVRDSHDPTPRGSAGSLDALAAGAAIAAAVALAAALAFTWRRQPRPPT